MTYSKPVSVFNLHTKSFEIVRWSDNRRDLQVLRHEGSSRQHWSRGDLFDYVSDASPFPPRYRLIAPKPEGEPAALVPPKSRSSRSANKNRPQNWRASILAVHVQTVGGMEQYNAKINAEYLALEDKEPNATVRDPKNAAKKISVRYLRSRLKDSLLSVDTERPGKFLSSRALRLRSFQRRRNAESGE